MLESEVCPWRKEGTTVKAPAVRATALIASRRVIIGSYCTSNGKGGHFGMLFRRQDTSGGSIRTGPKFLYTLRSSSLCSKKSAGLVTSKNLSAEGKLHNRICPLMLACSDCDSWASQSFRTCAKLAEGF